MTTVAEYMTVAGAWGFKASSRPGELMNGRGDLLELSDDRARLFLKDERVFTLYEPRRLDDLCRKLYQKPADSTPPQFTLF